jgi:hypothetical protein
MRFSPLNKFGLNLIAVAAFGLSSQAAKAQDFVLNPSSVEELNEDSGDHDDRGEELREWQLDDIGATEFVLPFACARANATQIATINAGNKKFDAFMKGCWAATNNSRWCEQLVRPNPSSRSVFTCTYGGNQPHRLIHPDENTWKYAYRAVALVQKLEEAGVSVQQIYNWWRPEPYNKNVGGAAGRHPYGTSVDVRFSTLSNMEKAFSQLCKWRSQGVLRAVGYYGSTGLHFGMGDSLANTWGKACK